MSTPDAPWRVYLAEWVTVWTSDAVGLEGQAEALQYWREKYRGRVRDEDWRVVPAFAGRELECPPYCVRLRLPNLQAEYKDAADARWSFTTHAGQDEAPRVVQRGSPEEQALLDYSRKMLKS